jgi:hypothetical protein
MLVLVEIGVLMLMATCLLSRRGLFVTIHSCFASLCIMIEYSCLNSISCFSHIVFDEFIAKEGEIAHKVG